MKTSPSLPNILSRRCRPLLALGVLLATVLPVTLPALSLPSSPVRLVSDGAPASRADRILVKPKVGVDLTLLHLQIGGLVLHTFPAIGNLQVVQLPAGAVAATVLNLYRASGLVQYAEPDFIVHVLNDPNDFRYWDGSLWGLHNTGQQGGTAGADIKAPQAWDLQNTAANIVVAVIDTGARLTHEDLAGNLWVNPGESGTDASGKDASTNGGDDDQDGYVDDVHGINTLTGSGDPTDDYGHGSHVSGIIGAVGNNSVGVVGIAWKVQLMELKFIDAQGNGAISDAVTCIDYARQKGARVINASWGSTGFDSQALHDAIASARDAGLLFVAASGNSAADNDTTPLYPASYDLDNIISVASTNRNDNLSTYSDFGANSVHLGAPGEDIFSCWNSSDSDYQYENGTSMATAFVSGAAAVVMAHFPGDNYAAVRQRILGSTDPLPSLAGKTITGGRLDLFSALSGATSPQPPAAPSGLMASAASASAINVQWTDNANNESGFTVERSTDNATFSQVASLGANTASYADTGLTASTTYYYRVRAFNSVGNSAYSNTASATTQAVTPPPQPPAAPSGLTASAASASAINVQWTDNANNESGFTVERSTDNATFSQVASLGANTASYADTGLTASTTYYYRVRAFNSVGNSAYSNTASATTQAVTPPPQPPAAPSGLTASAASASAINVQWTDNANNESGFTVERSTDNATFSQVASLGANTASYADTGLTASTTYYYRVRAFNSVGNSAYSNTASATTQTVTPPPQPPAAPSGLMASAASASAINVQWTDNANNESGFTVERSTDNATFSQVASLGANTASYADTGLTASTTYYYRVRAFNSVGNSAYSNTASATTQTVTPPPQGTVTVFATDPLASEAGPTSGQFTISRTGATGAALTVHYSLGGTATNGSDYHALSGTVTIPSGASSVTVQVMPIDDHIVELPETVILTLSPDGGYNVGLSNFAIVTITDNDLVGIL